MNAGILFAIGAYVCWGLSPLYWKWLQHVETAQLLCHRILWSFLLLGAGLLLARQGRAFRQALREPRVLLLHVGSASLVGINWITYVWAVNAGFIVETSLGYFITPLLSVLLGVLVLRERLRPGQWIPVGLVAIAIAYLTIGHGSLPWIALTLAGSWGLYGLIKKKSRLGSLHGLTMETGLLLLPVLAGLIHFDVSGTGAFLRSGTQTDLLLLGTGLVTATPLLLYVSAVRRIPLFQVGLLQYIGPTLQFILGVWVYDETFTWNQAIGFGLVWAALVLFVLEGFMARRARARPAAREAPAATTDPLGAKVEP